MPLPILLSKGSLILKILPHIGATIVSLEKGNSGNLLKSDSRLWDDKEVPEQSAFSGFKPYNGHTIWVSPQSQWWTQQDINTQRRDSASPWPPDPYINYGDYTIIRKESHCISLQSPESPVSGITIQKDIAINDDESIYLNTIFTNTTNKVVSWDIWYNTRVDGFSKVYVPVASDKDVRVVPVLNDSTTEMPYQIVNNFFSYQTTMPEGIFTRRCSKTYIYPNRPWIGAFTGNNLFVIRFEMHPQKSIHPDQALVEIYNHTESDTSDALHELEYHSPKRSLRPDESMEGWEVWKIFDSPDLKTDNERIAFLQQLISKGEL